MYLKPCYAVLGNPISHSKSPQIHQQFARQEKVEIEYKRIHVELGDFSQAVFRFFSEGGQGANVTLPFKVDAYHWVNEHSEWALAAGAVNTIIPLGDGRFRGENSDGVGLVYDITQTQGVSLSGKRVLIIGAGGAVRGVIPVLQNENPVEIVVANRTLEKAQILSEQFGIQTASLSELPKGYFDVVINGTSGGLAGQLPDIASQVLSKSELVYDMGYGAGAQMFLNFARESGANKVADGLGMLVAQAAFSYQLWRHFKPEIQSVIAYMRDV